MSKLRFDFGTIAIIVITLLLFVVALFEKGFTHDLLLEAGVFLVSVKLIIMSYRSNLATRDIRKQLDEIEQAINRLENTKGR
jgi:Flp pilus assembly protein TadB